MSDLDEVLKKEYRANIDKKVTYYLTEYLFRVLVIQKFILIPLATKTKITPNQVTIFGFLLVLLSFVCICLQFNVLAGIFYFLYFISDLLDGMLARYKNAFSKLGHFLDGLVDRIAFNFVYIVLYFSHDDISLYCVIFIILIFNIHCLTATYYIVPKLKTLKEIRRFGIKKWFFDRGFILGVDASLYDILVSLMLISCRFEFFMIFIGLIYLFDLLYRLHELKINLIIQEIKSENRLNNVE